MKKTKYYQFVVTEEEEKELNQSLKRLGCADLMDFLRLMIKKEERNKFRATFRNRIIRHLRPPSEGGNYV
ncbi:MAG: hypothetical protein HQL26_09740 [Candidatus Omnitrophica bacterium]|nr:hypothetical protein [Candidatus Omnitrophota bacterium]